MTSWPDIDEALADVAKQVRKAVQDTSKASGDTSRAALTVFSEVTSGGVAGSAEAFPRSSNIRLSKIFSEKDRDDFLRATFDFVAKFFEGSLKALCERNPGTSQTYDRIDSRRFVAILYRDVKSVAQGSVRLDFFGGRSSTCIAFSYNAALHSGSSNEMLTVEFTDQALFCKPMVMAWGGGGRDQHLSTEGAAEYLWAMFIGSVQGN